MVPHHFHLLVYHVHLSSCWGHIIQVSSDLDFMLLHTVILHHSHLEIFLGGGPELNTPSSFWDSPSWTLSSLMSGAQAEHTTEECSQQGKAQLSSFSRNFKSGLRESFKKAIWKKSTCQPSPPKNLKYRIVKLLWIGLKSIFKVVPVPLFIIVCVK